MSFVVLFSLLFIATVALAQDSVLSILPETRVTTCGCFSGVKGGREQRYCGTNCGLQAQGCLASTPCPRVVFGDPVDTEVRWGTSTSAGQPNSQSGMGFTGEVNKLVPLNQEFFIGRLTHFNLPIIGPAQSTDLTIQLRIPEFQVNQNFKFTLVIDETPNNENNGPCPYPSHTPCSDKITFDLSGFDTSKTFTVDGLIKYTLRLTGFKETRVSKSAPTSQFISEEKRENNAFLFAEVVAACPDTCVGGGTPKIISQPDGKKVCGCDCPAGAATACQRPLELRLDCSCKCPLAQCNGFEGDPNNNCKCQCPVPPKPCMAPKTEWDTEKCQCRCPANACGQGLLVDLEQCGCDCASIKCASGATPNPMKKCECECQKTCGPNQILGTNKCQCMCNPALNKCGSMFQWEVDPLNPQQCRCGCPNQCGTGCTAVGAIKECTDGKDQCCKNCKFTQDQCDDKDQCTIEDMCQEGGKCIGRPLCPQPKDSCSTVRCVPGATPSCQTVKKPDGERCGPIDVPPERWNRCENMCVDGQCTKIIPPDCTMTEAEKMELEMTGQQCKSKHCDRVTGQCVFDFEEFKPCNDKNLCTYDDECDKQGNCKGKPNLCDGQADGAEFTPKVCHVYKCDRLLGECVPQPAAFNSPCVNNATNLCELPGSCSGGVCLAGRKCPRLKPDEAECATSDCDPATGVCQKIPRPLGSPCILPSGFAKSEDFCGKNYTCNGLGNCTRGWQNPETANHSLCVAAFAGDAGKDVPMIVGLATGGTCLVMLMAALLTYCFVQQRALLDPSTWSTGPEVGLESNPLYDDANAASSNALYAG